jgi:hypothetical protein
MNEDFLHYLWQFHLSGKELTGTRGESIKVWHPGNKNTDSGPDFFNGKVKIGQTLWAGNIEIHVKASDWYSHGHQLDKLYSSIILHVVYENDRPVFRQNGEPIPTLELRGQYDEHLYETYQGFLQSKHWIPCEQNITRAGHFQIQNWLYRLALERLEQKSGEIVSSLRQNKNDFREVFYRKLLQNYGFKTNGQAFSQLALALPYAVLARHRDSLLQIEALLFGQAGMLEKPFTDAYPRHLQDEYRFLAQKYHLTPLQPEIWRFMRMYPSNFPTIRLAQFARLFYMSVSLLQKILEADRFTDIISLLQTEASEYWNQHYQFEKPSPMRKKRMGKASIHILLINTIIPFTFVYGQHTNRQELCDKALEWLALLPAEKNTITRHFSLLGVTPKNAMQSQALLQLKKFYCDKKQCLHCNIGHQLLKTI